MGAPPPSGASLEHGGQPSRSADVRPLARRRPAHPPRVARPRSLGGVGPAARGGERSAAAPGLATAARRPRPHACRSRSRPRPGPGPAPRRPGRPRLPAAPEAGVRSPRRPLRPGRPRGMPPGTALRGHRRGPRSVGGRCGDGPRPRPRPGAGRGDDRFRAGPRDRHGRPQGSPGGGGNDHRGPGPRNGRDLPSRERGAGPGDRRPGRGGPCRMPARGRTCRRELPTAQSHHRGPLPGHGRRRGRQAQRRVDHSPLRHGGGTRCDGGAWPSHGRTVARSQRLAARRRRAGPGCGRRGGGAGFRRGRGARDDAGRPGPGRLPGWRPGQPRGSRTARRTGDPRGSEPSGRARNGVQDPAPPGAALSAVGQFG